MTGKVTLKVTENGNLHVDTKLSEVSCGDKAWMLHCLASALDMDTEELQFFMDAELAFRKEGIVDYDKGAHDEG